MKRLTIGTMTLLLATLSTPKAHAQWAVFDSANFGQAVKEVSTQASQLTQLENQLQAQMQMLENLPQTVAPGVFDAAAQTQQLMQQIQGLQSNITGLQSQMQSLYPSNMTGQDPQAILAKLASMRQSQQNAYEQAQAVNAQAVQTQRQINDQVQTASSLSQGARGQVQAAQAGNQLLAALSSQLSTLNSAQAALVNAQAQEQYENRAEIAAGQADTQAALQNPGVSTQANGSP